MTVVCRGISEQPIIVKELIEKVKAHTKLIGFSANYNSIILYSLEGKESNILLEETHETVLKHEQAVALAVKKGLAFIRIRGLDLEETPGILGKISESLRLDSVNIFGILTITSSVLLFVDWSKRKKVLSLIKQCFTK
jgi:aspartokinase